MKSTANRLLTLTHIALSVATMVTALFLVSCSGKETNAQRAVELHLQNQGMRDIKVEFFYTNSSFPDKAYVAVSASHNFASASGTPQKEYLGYLLKQEGKEYKVEQNSSYTNDEEKAKNLLAGNK
jgi:hypothetical protein